MRSALGMIAGVWMVAMAAGAGAQVSGPASVRDLSVVQRPIFDLKPPAARKLTVAARLDRRDGVYQPGDEIKLNVRANEAAYITVVNVGASGKITVLFPNSADSNNHVHAGETLALPTRGWKIQVDRPSGVDVIKIFASTSPMAVYSSGRYQPDGAFQAYNGPVDEAARDLAVTMAADPQAEWAVDTRLISVRDGNAPPSPTTAVSDPAALGILASLPSRSAFRLAVDIAGDRAVHRIGEALRVRVRTERACRLTLLDIGSAGRVTVLFPNRLQRQSQIPAGETVILPSLTSGLSYELGGPEGREDVVAVCTADGRDFIPLDWDWGNDAFHTIGDRDSLERDLNIVVESRERVVGFAGVAYEVAR